MKNAFHKNILIGQAGVYAVAEKLCLHGHSPCFPGVDVGVDLITECGIRLQVKAAFLRKTKQFPAGAYTFNTHGSVVQVRGKIYKKRKLSEYHEICDFIVFACLSERRFFVVPADKVKGAFWLESREHNDTKALLGMGKYNRTAPSNKSVVLEYEDAWHLLDMDSALESIELAEGVESAGGATH